MVWLGKLCAFLQLMTGISAPSGFDVFSGTQIGQGCLDLSKFDAQGLKQWQVSGFQSVSNFNASTPTTNGFHLLHNLHVPAVEFPLRSNQKQCFSTLSPLPWFPRQHRNECPILWRNTEEENSHLMWKQNLHVQQNVDSQGEDELPVQVSANYVNGILHENQRMQRNQVPGSHQFEQFEQGKFLNNYVNARCPKQANFGLFPTDVRNVQVLDRKLQGSSTRKNLTRLHDLNSPRILNFGSGNVALNHVTENGSQALNGLHHCCLWNPTARCYMADDSHFWFLSSDGTYIKSCDPRLLYQKTKTVDEVGGRIPLMARDQHGCRLLQKKITEGPQEAVDKIFYEVIDCIVELMTDPFGNYLVQKLLEVCREDQRTRMLQEITRKPGDLVRISCDMHGTRAVQKVIETLRTPEHISIVVNSLKPCIVTLMKNMNGNHVAQRCLQFLMPAYTQFLFEAAAANCVELATDRHGCCVLQKCLSRSVGEHRKHLISEIVPNSLILSQDQFGNYVVQYIFELQVSQVVKILDQLEGRFGDLSMQKYSSNVVEKCLTHSTWEGLRRVIQELIDDPRLDQIMQDAYGNYVIQAALNISEGALEDALVEAIRPHIPVLRTSPYGKKVLLSSNRLKRLYL
ncbi:pumilio homolog 12-like isoform X2 [Rhodamnia argentea]|uniref:Pumilio homolog 12-like isoform X2 n=1 Tax=Rhodamnia argentea TaxID=178133 RepID=A0A8B8NNW5_9MYRT|nr:pumilio homolog 12-like isoform X2 [Rhodamnia argentea]